MRSMKTLTTAAAILLVMMSTTAVAQKIAFVEVTRLLEEAPQVAAVKEKIRKEFAHRDEELVAQQKQLKKLQDKLVKDGSIMSEGEAKRLERDILARRRKLKNATGEFQEDLSLRQNEELKKLRKVIADVVIEVAKKEKIDIVLEGGVVYASDSSNITEKVLKKLSQR
ncbi:MAG: OmpH family outer membrane protein [bacterium]